MYSVRLDDRKVFLHTNPLTIVVSVHIFFPFLKQIPLELISLLAVLYDIQINEKLLTIVT